MRLSLVTVVLVVFLAAPALAQPVISGVANNYSYIQPGLPNYGIAQGSIFDVFGTGLASSSTGLQSTPLQTSLLGVSLSVTVNGVTTQPLLYFISPGQIAAVLPSATPVGNGQIAVTNNGQTSAPAPIRVVRSAFGLLSQAAGSASATPAIALDMNANPLSATNAVNAGEYVTLWGSGVGPAPGDERLLQTPRDLAEIPLQVEIGGVPATVKYHGRSTYPGLDQINLIVPPGVTGCAVSVVVRTGDVVSNFATIPVSSAGRTCSDPAVAGSTTAIPVRTQASIGISRSLHSYSAVEFNGRTVSPARTTFTDVVSAAFYRFPAMQIPTATPGTAATNNPVVSIGNCYVYSFSETMASVIARVMGGTSGTSTTTTTTITPTVLDAGPAINVTGPLGTAAVKHPTDSAPFYYATVGGGFTTALLPPFIPESGGTFYFDNGAGGADIGPFKTQLTMAQPLVWTNADSIDTLSRSGTLTVTWKGGEPNTYVQISGGSSGYDGTNLTHSMFSCSAKVEDQQFTVPQDVLLSLPVSVPFIEPQPNFTVSQTSNLTLGNSARTQFFTLPGVDYAGVSSSTSVGKEVTFQ